MEVLTQSREFTKIELFKLAKEMGRNSLKNLADGTIINVVDFLHFNDKDKDGNPIELLTLKTDEDEVFVTNSSTCIETFINDVLEIYPFPLEKNEQCRLVKNSAKSKAGRDFIYFTIA